MGQLGFEAGKGPIGQAQPEEGGGEDGPVEEAVLPRLCIWKLSYDFMGVGGWMNKGIVDDGLYFGVISKSVSNY